MQEVIPPASGDLEAVIYKAAARLNLGSHSAELVKRMDRAQAEALHACTRPWAPQVLLAARLRPEAMALLAADWLQHEWPAMDCVLRFAEAQGEAGACAACCAVPAARAAHRVCSVLG